MKKWLLTTLLLYPILYFAQPASPYAIWENNSSVYEFVQIDPVTGAMTTINTLPGLQGLVVPGTSAINPVDSHYVFVGFYGPDIRLVVVHLGTGVVVSTNVINDNIFGIEYNCSDNRYYALWEDANSYSFVQVDPITATLTTIGSLPSITAHSGATFTLNPNKGEYNFMGLDVITLSFVTIDIATGNIINSTPFSNNVVGQFYDCNTDSIYGLWEDQAMMTYNLVSIDPATATMTDLGALPGVVPGYISEAFSYNASNSQYSFHGFAGPAFTMFTIDIPTRTISTSISFMENPAGWEHPDCCPACTPPVAGYSHSASDLDVNFTDGSTDADDWTWDFGDGMNSNDQNPIHTYSLPGTYTVCLWVTNSCGMDSVCQSVNVVITGETEDVHLADQIEIRSFHETGSIEVRLDARTDYTTTVYDLNGKVIATGIADHTQPFTAEGLEKGIYFVKVKAGEQISVSKIGIW